jgi:hypothetical protein
MRGTRESSHILSSIVICSTLTSAGASRDGEKQQLQLRGGGGWMDDELEGEGGLFCWCQWQVGASRLCYCM